MPSPYARLICPWISRCGSQRHLQTRDPSDHDRRHCSATLAVSRQISRPQKVTRPSITLTLSMDIASAADRPIAKLLPM